MTTTTALYGLIGYPVKHSFSACMQEAAFSHYGIKARYELFEVPPAQLGVFFKEKVKRLGLKGFNVTIPHKEEAVPFLEGGSISPVVRMIGAVNTVRVETDGSFSGFNTDGPGFGRDLKEKGVDVVGHKVVLLGAGGGAKAVALTLAAMRTGALEVFDILAGKSERLAGSIREFYPGVDVRVVDEVRHLRLDDAALLVNATPVGMKPGEVSLISGAKLPSHLFVYDLIYNPSQTPLLHAAQLAGCRWANGLGMLLYQGCLAFEHWTGKEAPVADMRRTLEKRVYG